MSKARIIATTMILLITLGITTPLTSHASSGKFEVIGVYWNSLEYPSEVSPGDRGVLIIQLRYLGTGSISGISGELELPEAIESLTGEDRVTSYFEGVISRNSIFILTYNLHIRPEAEIGSYEARLKISYAYNWGSPLYEEELDVEIKITGKPKIETFVEDKVLKPGLNIVDLILSNVGEAPASNVRVEVSTSNMVILGNRTFEIGELEENSVTRLELELYVPSYLSTSTTSMQVEVYYTSLMGVGYTYVENYLLLVGVEEEPPISFKFEENSIHVGEEELVLIVSNTGSETLYNISFEASSNTISLTPIDELEISELQPNTTMNFKFKTYTPQTLEGGIVLINVRAIYEDANGIEYEVVETLNLKVERLEPAMLDVRIVNHTLTAGIATTEILVVNRGGQSISNVKVKLDFQNPILTIEPSYFEVGKLNVGDLSTLTITIHSLPVDRPTDTLLKVEIDYLGADNLEYNVVDALHLRILPPTYKPELTVKVEPRTLKALTEQTIHVELSNNGVLEVRSLNLNIKSENPNLKFTPESFYIEKLEPMENTVLNIESYTTIVTGPVKAILNLEYMDREGRGYSDSYVVIFEVQPVILNFNLDLKPKLLNANSEEHITLTIKNTGNSRVENVTLTIIPPLEMIVENSSTLNVGSLEVGDYKSISIKVKTLKVDFTTSKILTINLEYYDSIGNRYVESRSFTLILKPVIFKGLILASLEPKTLYSPTSSILKVEISNIGVEDVYNLEVEVEKLSPLVPSKPLTVFKIGKLEAGDRVYLEVPVYVPEYSGVVEVLFNLRYYDKNGNAYSQKVVEGVEVLPLKTFLNVEVKPRTLISLEETILNLDVSNLGGSGLSQVKIDVDVPQQLIPLSNTSFYIDILPPNTTLRFPVKIKSLQVNSRTIVPVVVKFEYLVRGGSLKLESKTIYLEVKPTPPTPPLSVEVKPDELIIGERNKVSIEVENRGSNTIRGLELLVSPSQNLKLFGTGRVYVDNLEPGGSRRFEIELYVPLGQTGATASLTISSTYLDEGVGKLKSETYLSTFLLRGIIELSLVDVAVVPENPRVGEPFSITMTITNTGTSPAYAAYAIPIIGDLPIRSFGPKSVYIGDVGLNTPTTITLNLLLLGSGSGIEITLPVKIVYMDNLRTLHSTTFNVTFTTKKTPTTTSPQAGESAFPTLEAFLIGVVVAFLGLILILLVKRLRR